MTISNKKYNILVVDDNEANRYILYDHLLELGYNPTIAESGIAALNQIETNVPDLILLDIIMPGMNGFEVLERLKKNKEWQHIPVIINSALDDLNNIIEGIEKGADDYMIKPCNTRLLDARLKSCLEKKELIDEQIRYQQRLEEANKIIKLQNEDLVTANSTKDKFINIASHDLRSPLSIISLCAELFLRKSNPGIELGEKEYEMIKKVQNSAILMTSVLNDFLDYQLIISGEIKLSIELINLSEIISEITELFEPLSKEKKINIAYNINGGLPNVKGDGKRIKQVISNYLSNAIKFSPKNTSITCSAREQEDNVRIEIEDEGPGVPHSERDDLFKEFSNISNKPTNNEFSSGLGLSIVKRLILEQNGEVGASFPEEKGSIFWFQLPIAG